MQAKNKLLFRKFIRKWHFAERAESNSQSTLFTYHMDSYRTKCDELRSARYLAKNPLIDDRQIDDLEYDVDARQTEYADHREIEDTLGKMSNDWSMFKVTDNSECYQPNRVKAYFHPAYTYAERRNGYRGYSKADADYLARQACLRDYETIRQYKDGTRNNYDITVKALFRGKEIASASVCDVDLGVEHCEYTKYLAEVANELKHEIQDELRDKLAEIITQHLSDATALVALLQALPV